MAAETTTSRPGPPAPLGWALTGTSCVYLAHFASLYTQLPGLYGGRGLSPVSRMADLLGDPLVPTWLLQHMPSPEAGMEALCVTGLLVAAAQLALRPLRYGIGGMAAFSVEWLCWHDLVTAGGRFTAYQMDSLLLDVAPLTVLAASGLAPAAATFGLRWLLTRLYLGAGAVKLLSCDASWRDLSAVHWHLQSQPLPNPLGAAAFGSLPTTVGEAATLGVLVVEMAAPFLFLVPSASIRRVAFVANVVLMVGIALFGNFGALQALLVVVGLALLVEPPPPTAAASREQQRCSIDTAMTGAALLFAAAATGWTLHDVFTSCEETWPVAPLVYAALALAVASIGADGVAGRMGRGEAATAALLLCGSAAPLAQGLDVELPAADLLDSLNLGSQAYGLFAVITGVGGRPVGVIEGAASPDGPWLPVPLRYQVNDPTATLPLCWPHFPRMDWTLWFAPLGDRGVWIARLLRGIADDVPGVTSLIDEPAYREAFPTPPQFVRYADRTFTLDGATNGATWAVASASADEGWQVARTEAAATAALASDLAATAGPLGTAEWPSFVPLRLASERVSPEQFIWASFLVAAAAQRAAPSDDGDALLGLDVPALLRVLGSPRGR